MAADDVVMRTEKLTKVYPGGLKAVDELDLEVHQGEIFGLLGPNGAGKTTTAGMLTTRVIPTSGRAFVGGIDVVAHPTAAKQVIGVVPQSNTLDRSLTVWENLYFHGRFFGMSATTARTEADRLLEQFRLSERGKEPVAALSGGMAQRLMVARAIMHRPATLFLDEPTAGLDPQSRLALWEILGELHAEGQTILLTTHYMEEADELCNRLAIIDRGRLPRAGPPGELKRSTGADTVVTVSADGDLDALAKVLEAEVPGAQQATASTRRCSSRCARNKACCRWCSPSRNGTASRCRTSPSPSPRSRPSSSTSPGRTSANDRCQHPRGADHVGAGPQAHRRLTRRVPRPAPARPGRAPQDAQGVHPAHDPPAVPAGVRVHVRVPEDRPGCRWHRARRVASPRCSSPASSGSRS